MTRFSRTTRDICQGGMMDSADLYELDRDPQRLIRALELRIGSVFAFAATLGWELAAGAANDRGVLQNLTCLGRDVGVAYALSESVAEFQTIEKTGRELGAGWREGTYSLPVLYAIRAEPRLRKHFARYLGTGDVDGLVLLLRETPALDLVREDQARRVESAYTIIASLDASRHAEFKALVGWVAALAHEA